jgi:RNA polymerase sigma-70 factor, ECF subfamily
MSSFCEAATISSVDRRLFEDLLRKHHRQAYSLAYRMTGNEADAEDLVQEAFVRAFRFFDRYDTRLPFTSWLYRIMTNAHIDAVRRRGKLRTVSIDEPIKGEHGESSLAWDLPDTADTPEESLMSGVLDADIQKALLAVPDAFRTAVVLADIEGLSYEEIADVMDCSVGTVRSRIHRGRKLLRRSLAARAVGGASNEPRCSE